MGLGGKTVIGQNHPDLTPPPVMNALWLAETLLVSFVWGDIYISFGQYMNASRSG